MYTFMSFWTAVFVLWLPVPESAGFSRPVFLGGGAAHQNPGGTFRSSNAQARTQNLWDSGFKDLGRDQDF